MAILAPRWRADLHELAGIDDLLNEVDARTGELARRASAILVRGTDGNGSDSRNE
jgi:hypothetical protein